MMELEDFDFSGFAKVGYSVDEMIEGMRLLHKALNPPLIMTAPDGVPISDTEYAGMGSGAWSMETGNPLDLLPLGILTLDK